MAKNAGEYICTLYYLSASYFCKSKTAPKNKVYNLPTQKTKKKKGKAITAYILERKTKKYLFADNILENTKELMENNTKAHMGASQVTE